MRSFLAKVGRLLLEPRTFDSSDFAPVAAALNLEGFPTHRTASGWTIDCSNDVSDFDLRIQQERGLTMMISPLAEIAEPHRVPDGFYRDLPELNHNMNFGKLGISDDIVTLTRELPLTKMEPEIGVREVKVFSYAQERAMTYIDRSADRSGAIQNRHAALFLVGAS